MMDLGGIKYPCSPFNGWFVSIEIARNLLERYKATLPLANAMRIDPSDKMIAQKVLVELETAILYSFDKQGFTMVDPTTAGQSFMTHCKRERVAGRECPAQWSWIGGLVGKSVKRCQFDPCLFGCRCRHLRLIIPHFCMMIRTNESNVAFGDERFLQESTIRKCSKAQY